MWYFILCSVGGFLTAKFIIWFLERVYQEAFDEGFDKGFKEGKKYMMSNIESILKKP